MAITPGLCAVAKLAFLKGEFQAGDRYKVALYSEDADLNALTTAYSAAGEVKGQGYVAGGQELTGIEFGLEGVTAMMGFSNNPVWRNATITARGALIYNASRRNAAVLVVAFPRNVVSTNGNWVFPIPQLTPATALVRLL